jgi:small subunit ribosomal protein S20
VLVAHSLSAKKRIRQNAKRRAQNRGRKADVRGVVREFNETLLGKDKAKSAASLKAAAKKLDQIASTKSIHKNAAARRKSRMQKKLNALLKASS